MHRKTILKPFIHEVIAALDAFSCWVLWPDCGFSEKVWSRPASIQNRCMTNKNSEVVPNNVLHSQKIVFFHFGLGFDSQLWLFISDTQFFMNHNLEISIVAKWVEPESKFRNGDFLTVQWVHRKHSDMKNKCFLESWPSMVSTENHRKRCRFWTEIEANCSTEVIECWTPYPSLLDIAVRSKVTAISKDIL